MFTYSYKKTILVATFFMAVSGLANAQQDTSKPKFFNRIEADTSTHKLNMDATYNRPFLQAGRLPIAIGGYMETNTQNSITDGVGEGFSFQFRRITIFISSTIAKKIKFLSEIEFEDGGKEISVEYASLDFEFHPLLIDPSNDKKFTAAIEQIYLNRNLMQNYIHKEWAIQRFDHARQFGIFYNLLIQ